MTADRAETKARTISHDDYLKLLGLMTLAKDHTRMVEELESAMNRLTGLDPDDDLGGSWVSDALYGISEPDPKAAVKHVLDGAKITVEEERAT